MGVTLIHSGVVEPITVHLVDTGGDGVTALVPTLTIRRSDATSWWNGSAMVSSGVQLAMTEVDSGDAPGDYRYSFETSGADAAKYVVEVTQSSVSGLVANLPAVGEVEVSLGALLGQYDGAIWIDTLSTGDGGQGVPGSVLGVNGLQSRPVDNIAEARLLADALGVRAYRIRGDVTLDQEYQAWRFDGWAQVRDSGRVSLNSSFNLTARFSNLFLTSGATSGSVVHATDCQIVSGLDSVNGTFVRCAVGGVWSIQPDGRADVFDCFNRSGASQWGVDSDFATADSEWNIRQFSGALVLSNLVSGNTIRVGLADGSVDLTGGLVKLGTVEVTGVGRLFGSLSPTASVTLDTLDLVDPEHIQRLYGANTRTRLFFPDNEIVDGVDGATRNVLKTNPSHMIVEAKEEDLLVWNVPADTYFVVFNYSASAVAGDSPRSAAIHRTAPMETTFNTVPFEVE